MKKNYALFSMKKQLLLTLVCTLLLGVSTLYQSFAQLIWSDSFEYAAGTLLNNTNGWTAHSGEGTNPVAVSAGSLSYLNYEPSNLGNKADLPTSGEDVNHSFPSQINSGTVYAAFMINVTEAKNTADYFVHFMGQSNTTFAGKVWAKSSGSGFQLGITKQSSTVGDVVYADAVLDNGTTYLIVVKYTIVTGTTNDEAFLFINPVVGSPEPATPSATATPSIGSDPSYLAGFALRQGQASNAPNLSIDGIRVASTWAEAVKMQGSGGDQVATPIISPNGGVVFTPQTVSITCTTPSNTIRYTLDGSEPSEASTQYTSPLNITSTTTVKAKAWAAGLNPSYTATTTYTFPIEVPNIAAFKAANSATSSTVYKITGDVTYVYNTGRYFYIKDATAGLLIYDNATPIITKSYNNGDLIPGGVLGTCTIYNGMYELIPTADLATGTPGAPVQPIAITMANLLANFETYESQLVKLDYVTFDEGAFGTGAAANIKIYQDEDSLVCRNHFGHLTDYVTDPSKHFDVTGLAIPYNDDRQIAPRDLDDIKESGALLSGTVTITGSAVFGETLTATANLTSNPVVPDLGEISYQWMRGGNMVGSNSTTYTLTQADIGSKITVTVTTENTSGSVTSAETATVTKASQTAPEEPTLNTKTTTSIMLNEISGCEFRMDGGAWQTSTTFDGLTPNTTYSFEARKVETETHLASDPGPASTFKTDPLGVNENELNKIQVYGCQNNIFIKNVGTLRATSINIFDMTGRLVYQNEINEMETVITLQVNTGIYHVVLQNNDTRNVTKVLITK